MGDFTITERTEPFTLDEVFSFIDETHISKSDSHELKSRIVDAVQEVRAKAIDEFAERLSFEISESFIWDILATMHKNSSLSDTSGKIEDYVVDTAKEIAEQMKGGAE